MEEEREYKISKAKNGFIIRFEHEKGSMYDQNKRVAHDLEEIVHLIREDLLKEPVIE